MRKTHTFNLVPHEHFQNISLSNQAIESILYSQFNFAQWFIARLGIRPHSSNGITLSKFNITAKNASIFAYLIQCQKDKQVSKNKQNSEGIKNKKVTLKGELSVQNILICQETYAEQKQKMMPLDQKLYEVYSFTGNIDRLFKDNNKKLLDKVRLIMESQATLIGTIKFVFYSRVSSSDKNISLCQNEREHIEMSVQEQSQLLPNISIIQFLCQSMQADYQKQFMHPGVPLRPISAQSFLTLQQGNSIKSLRYDKNAQTPQQKMFQFVFRSFHRMTTKKELLKILYEYSGSVYQKVASIRKKTSVNSNQNLSQTQVEHKTPSHHFMCSLSNAFIPFVLSLSSLITWEKMQYFLMQYTEIVFPSYSEYFEIDKKGQVKVKLPDRKFKEIKKAISFITNKVILQYSDEIIALAAQLSFIFQIVQLLNQSLLTKELVDQLLLLLFHYGGFYPDMLFKADEWVTELTDQTIPEIRFNSNSSKPVAFSQNAWYELNKIISPGRLTRFKKKIQPLIQQILQNVKNSGPINFQDHLKLTSNAFTIIAFDITAHTVRFFNYKTCPKMNIIDLLYLQENFQCIELDDTWTPYKVVYKNDTFLINLQKATLTAPIGIDYLEQFLDNKEIRKRYFSFDSQQIDQNEKEKYSRCVMSGKSHLEKICDQRLTQFRSKRHQILSVIKRLLFENIPKTKLIWKFIRYESSSTNQKETTQSQSTITVLRKIEIINHAYNLIKTIILHEKNVNREVWLESQCNFLDQVKNRRTNFIPEGEQNKVLEWEIQRITYLRSIINKSFKMKINSNQSMGHENNPTKIQYFSQYIKNCIQSELSINFPYTNKLSETEGQSIKLFLQEKLKNIIEKVMKQENNNSTVYLKQIRQTLQQALQKIQFNIKQIPQMIDCLLNQTFTQLKIIENEAASQLAKSFSQIQKNEIQTILQSINEHLKLLKKYTNADMRLLNETKVIWFEVQCHYQKLIENLMLGLTKSLNIEAKDLMIQIYMECGAKDAEMYGLFRQNFASIQSRMNDCIAKLRTQDFSSNKKNKINFVMDCKDNSELFTSLHLRLLFKKIQIINQKESSYKKVKHDQLFENEHLNVSKSIPLSKYFQSFTCSGFQSIAIFQLVLKYNFSGPLSLLDCNQILLKLPAYKHLLSWRSLNEIEDLFHDFQWFLIEQNEVEEFYKSIYTSQYQNQLKQSSGIQEKKFAQIKNLFAQKTSHSKSSDNKFGKQRKKVQKYLIYEILEEWIQNFQETTSVGEKQLSLDQIINRKIFYNNKVLESYSSLQKKQVISVLKRYILKFGTMIQQILSIAIDTLPHSPNQWKSIILKNALSGRKLKLYIHNLLQSYNLAPNLTFEELKFLGKDKFQGMVNIILWNCRKQSIQICNFITKPKMPFWLAIFSACSQPFYMKEQHSHLKLQTSQRSRLSSAFHQFPQNRNSTFFYRQSLLKQSKSVAYKRGQSNFKVAKNHIIQGQKDQANLNALPQKIWFSPPLLDQQVNLYLSPCLLQTFPLGYMTNQHFGIIKSSQKQRHNIMTISFQKAECGFCQRMKNTFFEQKQLNFSISSLLGLSFNKKDKDLNVLKQYLRKIFKESHFYFYYRTIMEDNRIKYRKYNKIQQPNVNCQISYETHKFSDDFTSFTPYSKQQANDDILSENDRDENFNNQEREKVQRIRISKLSIQCVDDYGDIIGLNQNKILEPYTFYQTYEAIQKSHVLEEGLPSSKQLIIGSHGNMRDQIKKLKEKDTILQEKQDQKIQSQNVFKRMIRRLVLSCGCFDSEKMLKKEPNKKPQLE